MEQTVAGRPLPGVLRAMVEDYVDTPSQLLEGYRHASSIAGDGLYSRAERSVLAGCGMGGSGFSIEAARLFLEDHGLLLGVVRCHMLPSSYRRGDPVVAVSYSGETLETIMCARSAAERGSPLGSVSTGGTLHGLVESLGGVAVRIRPVRSGMPRTGLGALTGAIIGLVMGEGVEGEIRRIAGVLRDPGIHMAAGRLARFLESNWNSVPVIVSCGRVGFLAYRWRSELAENDMKVAIVEEYPEAGHNAINAWDGVDKQDYSFIILRGDPEDRLCEAITGYIIDKHRDAEHMVVDLSSYYKVHPLAAVLAGSMIVGISSAMLASKTGIQEGYGSPKAIMEYKEEIRRRINSRPPEE